MSTNISLQTFTVRKKMKSTKDISSTFEKLKELGVHHIELARVKFTKEEGLHIAEVCKRLGIKVSSSQIKYKKIMKEYDNIVTLHQLWACEYIAVSVLPIAYLLKGEEGLREFADKLNILGKRLNNQGLKLLYHHHNFEFTRYGNQTGLEILMERTNPDYVNLMMDTYWTQRGGRNPVDQIEKFHKRIKVIHIRDFKVELSKRRFNYVTKDAALGDGNLDMKSIIETALKYNIPYLPIEQSTNKPFDEIEKSIAHIKKLGFGDLFDAN